MNDLDGKKGTIFRYHNHENSFLNTIYQQLLEEQSQQTAFGNFEGLVLVRTDGCINADVCDRT